MRVGVLPLPQREGQRKNTRSTRATQRFDMHRTRRTTLNPTISSPNIICRMPIEITTKKTGKKSFFSR
jgi:hypothetical protein